MLLPYMLVAACKVEMACYAKFLPRQLCGSLLVEVALSAWRQVPRVVRVEVRMHPHQTLPKVSPAKTLAGWRRPTPVVSCRTADLDPWWALGVRFWRLLGWLLAVWWGWSESADLFLDATIKRVASMRCRASCALTAFFISLVVNSSTDAVIHRQKHLY